VSSWQGLGGFSRVYICGPLYVGNMDGDSDNLVDEGE